VYIYSYTRLHTNSSWPRTKQSHLVVVLGSGGHTAEMMSILRDVDPRRYIHRTYIISSGDSFSARKASEVEGRIQSKYNRSSSNFTKAGSIDTVTGTWDVKTVPRARKIHQPLYTAPLSSLYCLLGCLRVLYSIAKTSTAARFEYPDAIITNGPATAVMVISAAYLLKLFGIAPLNKMRIIYVESWARVRTLSLSGRILLWTGVCDIFLVQWESLAKAINGNGARKKVEWKGFLVE
jgi:beta-1,4-N-acetylglucosaminyltransferase